MLIGRDGSLKMIIPHLVPPFDPNFTEVIEALLKERIGEDGKVINEDLESYEEEVKALLQEGPQEANLDDGEKKNVKERREGKKERRKGVERGHWHGPS
jgi:hypothetical protein